MSMRSDAYLQDLPSQLPATGKASERRFKEQPARPLTEARTHLIFDVLTCATILACVCAVHACFSRPGLHALVHNMEVLFAVAALTGCLLRLYHRGQQPCTLSKVSETSAAVQMSLHMLLLLVPGYLLLRSRAQVLDAMIGCFLLPFALPLQRSMRALLFGERWHADRSNSTPDPLVQALSEHAQPAGHRVYLFFKRVLDVSVSAFLLILLSPVLFFIAALIKMTSKGPAIFAQDRVGRNGATFRMYKFRSMHDHSQPYERSPQSSTDPRVTRIGRWLRRASLDELPQLLNVLSGTMSLVGPRPEMPFIVRSYSARQRERLCVQPGLTGLWQLSKDRAHPIHDNLHHDLHYIRARSLSLDVAILIHTLLFSMGEGI